MMDVRKLSRYFWLIAVITACSDREKAILGYNSAPQIMLVDADNNEHITFDDSLRFSDEPASFYNVKLKMSDQDQNLWRCQVVLDSGRVTGYYQGMEMKLPSVRVDQEVVELSISPKQTGLNQITFVAEDRFNVKAEAVLNLFVFSNLKPVAVLESRAVNGNEYEFSGQRSYDQDERFGGQVSGYEFTIDGVTFKTPSPTVRHIFARPGTYIVRLRVLDNNNEFSEEIESRIIID